MIKIAGTFIFGLVLGFVVNYISDVLPTTRKFTQPKCLSCQHVMSWKEYLFSTRCKACDKWYSVRHWVVLFIFPAISVLLWIYPNARVNYWIGLLLITYLGIIFVIDVEYRAILHMSSIVGAIIFLGVGISLHGVQKTVLGGVAGFLIMLGLYYFGILFGKWLAKRKNQDLAEPALGFGDVNLAGVIGLGLGWPGITAGLFLAILLAGLISIIYIIYALIAKKYRAFLAIPYAPFLILATLFLLYRN